MWCKLCLTLENFNYFISVVYINNPFSATHVYLEYKENKMIKKDNNLHIINITAFLASFILNKSIHHNMWNLIKFYWFITY